MLSKINQSLGYQVNNLQINSQDEIPWIVKLLENPSSPVSLPGRITLYNHDCLHILLNASTTPVGEAFVLGFTMGNASDTRFYHVLIFKLFAKYFYPKPYKLLIQEFKYFDAGFEYGKIATKDINQINFFLFQDNSINKLRRELNIDLDEIAALTINQII